ncbi:MAG: type II restriction endonuclease [Deltaproteobacteria bacterium]|nr:type II restriction endonuclease [Deltaproteobacteria bacterium]
MRTELVRRLIERWRDDPAGTYQTWFLWDERLKNFRSIRRGVEAVVQEIEQGTFGNVYKGSSLEVVVHAIAEQRQIFKGADHAFLWKPKLRIPDIYENPDNQRAFATFLSGSCGCSCGDDVVNVIRRLDQKRIKGLGPAAANILYFLHPTLAPPFNTAMVKGYNALFGAKVKLGSWPEYLAMRDGILRFNGTHRQLLSNDLGAVAGLLFDVGSGRYHAPPADDEDANAWLVDLEKVRQESVAERKAHDAERLADLTHTEVQGRLRDLGKALGFSVWVAANDRSRRFGDGTLADGCLVDLPPALTGIAGADAIRLIDVLWLEEATGRVAAAFEVEHTTSIYSGIVRLLDLTLGAPEQAVRGLFLVAPDAREKDVRAQLARPAFQHVAQLGMRFLPYGELDAHGDAIARFGSGLKPIEAIARLLA